MRKTLTFLSTIGIGLVLWLTRKSWIPLVLNQLPLIKENSDLLQAVEAVISVGLILIGGIVTYATWIRGKKGFQTIGPSEAEPQPKPVEPGGGRACSRRHPPTPDPSVVPIGRLLRSAIPDFSSTRDTGPEWTRRRLGEAFEALRWIDVDCGFEPEDYVGLSLAVTSARVPARYTVAQIAGRSFGGQAMDHQRHGDTRFQEYRSRDILKLFSKLSGPMVLLGGPGSGKSISLRHLGRVLIQKQLHRLDEDSLLIPVYLHLGDYTASTSDGEPVSVEDFLADYASRVWDRPREETERRFRELAEAGRLVFLLDSMDEMPRDGYVERYDALRAFMRRYGLCRFVFACRPTDYDHRLHVTEISVEPLDTTEVVRYLKRFLGRACGWSAERTQRAIDRLRATQPDLLSLLLNPFHLKLAALYIAAAGELPSSFASLYSQLVHAAWEAAAQDGVAKNDPMGLLSFEDFTRSLGWIAYCMTVNVGIGTAIDETALIATSARLAVEDADPTHIHTILGMGKRLRLIQIREFGDKTISFQHHKLQEYFTALYLVGKETQLAEHLPRTGILGGIWWEETITLLAAITSSPMPLIDYLLGINLVEVLPAVAHYELDAPYVKHTLEGARVELLARCYEVAKDRLPSSVLSRIISEVAATLPQADPVRRVAYARSLTRLQHPKADKLLLRLRDDKSAWVREEAFAALLNRQSATVSPRRFIYTYLYDSLKEGKGLARGKTVAAMLLRRRQSLDTVPAALIVWCAGVCVGFATSITLLVSAVSLLLLGVSPALVLACMLLLAWPAYQNARLFRVITLRRQASLLIVTASLFGLIYLFTRAFGVLLGCLLTLSALATAQLLYILLLRILGGKDAIARIWKQGLEVLYSHSVLHEEFSVLSQEFYGGNRHLSVNRLQNLFDLYARGCLHIHQGVVQLLREGYVDAESYNVLKGWAMRLHHAEPYYNDIWRIVSEKELQLRRLIAVRKEEDPFQRALSCNKCDLRTMGCEQVEMLFRATLGSADMVRLANLFIAVGNISQALNAMEKAIDRAPGDPSLVVRLGGLLVNVKHYAKALQVFEKGVAKFPNHAAIAYWYALMLRANGRLKEARSWAAKACELSPLNRQHEALKRSLEQRPQTEA